MPARFILSLFVLLLLYPLSQAQEKRRRSLNRPQIPVDELVFSEKLFGSDVAELMPKASRMGFKWMSRQKTSLRSSYPKLTLLDEAIGEVVLRSEEGKVSTMMVSLYNRGDDGDSTLNRLNQRFDAFSSKLTEKLGTEARDRSRSGIGDIQGRIWITDTHACLMELALNKDDEPEFLRLLVKSADEAHSRERMRNRSALRQSIVKRDDGDVFIDGVPMVDQGAKGYCAVASAQRIFNYYGNGVDMHELAQAAGTTANSGTSLPEMVEGLKKAMNLVHSRVLILYEKVDGVNEKKSDQRSIKKFLRELSRDCKAYNRLAEDEGKPQIVLGDYYNLDIDVPRGQNPRTGLPAGAEPEIWKLVQKDKSEFKYFKSKIEQYIDQGVPVAWALRLGMFKEKGLPQTAGGHMRLIIGYNEKTDEIIYSDSWGAGHDYKKMPAINAFCMTTATMVLVPNK